MTRLTAEARDELRRKIDVADARIKAGPSRAGVIPLVLNCSWSSCRNGRHSLDHTRRPPRGSGSYPAGHCQACGERVIVLADALPYDEARLIQTAALFNRELIRAHYWSARIDLRAYNKALRKGRIALYEQARTRVRDAMVKPGYNGRGAPYNGDVVAYAQHAVAACCRRCAAYWHGLPSDIHTVPSEEQIEYVIAGVIAYLDLRLPDLPDAPTAVPYLHQTDGLRDFEVVRMDEDLAMRIARGDDPAGLLRAVDSAVQLGGSRGPDGGSVAVLQIALSMPAA